MSMLDATLDPGLLADLAARQPTVDREQDARRLIVALCAEMRGFFHPKQAAFFRVNPEARNRATTKTRRAGATAGGVRELIARALEISGFRATYATTTRIEAKERAWESDTQSGFADIARQFGAPVDGCDIETVNLAGIFCEIRPGELALEFSNGSRIDLFGADNERALRKKRGVAKHVFWVDEAQDFPFLEKFYKAVVSSALNDYTGECWLTGTPGKDCAGFFFEVTRQDDTGLLGWEVHRIAQTDNPFFGKTVQTEDAWYVDDNRAVRHGPYETQREAEEAAVAIRWENTAGEAIRKNGWSLDDPDLRREQYAQWVSEDARYVYPVHGVPPHILTYAPLRTVPFPLADPRYRGVAAWYDHATSVADLPWNKKSKRDYQWLYAIGGDFGWNPDPFAVVLWAFTHELPDIFEMFSWKATKILPDDQAKLLLSLWNMTNAVVLVGDPAGKQADFEAWRQRLNLPIDEADKHGRNSWEEFLANDVRAHRVHYREHSPLLLEHRHLVYLPTKPGKPRAVDKYRRVNGIVHGDDCSMAGLYASRHLTHYMHRAKPDKPEPGTREAYEQEERVATREVERFHDRAHRAKRDRDDQDWEAIESAGQREDYAYEY